MLISTRAGFIAEANRPRFTQDASSETSLRRRSLAPLFVLVCLTAPYVFLRWGFDDYSQGSSLTLVDAFLFLASLSIVLTAINAERARQLSKTVSYPLLKVGFLFTTLCLLSGLESVAIYESGSAFSISRLLSGTSQYAFVLVFLPFFASHYLSLSRLHYFFRCVAIGYLLPMIATLLFLSHTTPERVREVFFFANRALGSYGNANTFSGLLVVVLPYYIFLSLSEKGLWRWVGYIGVGLSLICLFLTVSFSGMLSLVALIVANVVIAVFWRRHPLRTHRYRMTHFMLGTVAFLFASSAIAAVYIPTAYEDVAPRLFFLDETNTRAVEIDTLGNGADRLRLIAVAMDLVKARNGGLLTGHGIRQTEAFRDFSFAGPHQEVHLIYLLLWIEGGLGLAICFCAYLVLLIRNVTQLGRQYPAEAVCVGSAVLGLILFGFTYPHMYMRFFWIPLLPAFRPWDSERETSRDRPSVQPTLQQRSTHVIPGAVPGSRWQRR